MGKLIFSISLLLLLLGLSLSLSHPLLFSEPLNQMILHFSELYETLFCYIFISFQLRFISIENLIDYIIFL